MRTSTLACPVHGVQHSFEQWPLPFRQGSRRAPSMDLRQLRYFVASAEEGNMGRAARRSFVVQSALSRQVQALEREVGAPLFHRGPRGVRLTEAGEAFLPHARRTLDAAATALEAARAVARGERGLLRVAPPDVGPWTRRVAEALDRLRSTRAGMEVELVALPWTEHVQAVLEGRIDVGFAIAADPGDHPAGISARVLDRTRLRTALLPAGHPLGRRRSLALPELAEVPMVLSAREAMPSLHDAILRAVTSAGIQPVLVAAPRTFAAVAQLVAGGAGWAAVLDDVRSAPPPGTVARRVRGLEADLELHVLVRAGEPDRLASAFLEALGPVPEGRPGVPR